MEKTKAILQTFERSCASPTQVATIYLTLLTALNSLPLTPREIQLLAFTATRGSISSGSARQQFINQYGSSKATIANMVHKLVELKYLIRKEKQIVVNQKLSLDFTCPLVIAFTLKPAYEGQ